MTVFIFSVVLLAVLGILIGILLGVAGKVFAVETDERVEKVRECLPGNNCGGCGYPGCDGLAKAIAGRWSTGSRQDCRNSWCGSRKFRKTGGICKMCRNL